MKKLIGCVMIALTAGGTFALEQMSPFDDAAYWFRGGVDLNGNGFLDSGSKEYVNVVRAGLPDDATHVGTYASTAVGQILAKEGSVVMPYAGRVLSGAPYLHLDQPFVTNGTVMVDDVEYVYGQLKSNYLQLPNLFANLPGGVHCTNHTTFIRFRDESKVSQKEIEHNLFAHGYKWEENANAAGLAFNLGVSGSRLYPKVYCGNKIYSYDDSSLYMTFGKWCDLGVVVEGRKVTLYICSNLSESPLTNRLVSVKSFTVADTVNPAVNSGRRNGRIGGEQAGTTAVITNGLSYTVSGKAGGTHDDPGCSNMVKAFRGDVQTFAFWQRALTEDEIRQVMSEARPAVVQMGLANGNSDEFTKAESTTDGSGLHPEKWNPVLNAANPTRSVKFTVADGLHDVSQYLRIRPIAGSSTATLAIALDGKPVITQSVPGDADALVYFKATLMTKGEHTLTLTRTDTNGGDFTIDALKIYGSWRLGTTADTYGGMVHESEYPYQYNQTPRQFPLTDGNIKHFSRGVSGGPNGSNGKHVFTFDIPEDLMDKMRDASFTLGFNGGAGVFKVVVNDQVIATNIANGGARTLTVPVSILKAKGNVLYCQLENSNYLNISKYCFSLGRLISGAMLILK